MDVKILLIVLVVFFLVSCLELSFFSANQSLNQTVNQTLEEINQSEELDVSGACVPRWDCISSSHKAYLLENCTWTKSEKCERGCTEGECRRLSACIPGFKCYGNSARGFQTELCAWIGKEECPYGCKDNECLPKPNGTVVVQPDEPEPVLEPVLILDQGKTETVEVNGLEHELKIYALEEGKVKIQLDDFRSDWLAEGEEFLFANGLTVSVKTILFQSYEGGVKAVEYRLK